MKMSKRGGVVDTKVANATAKVLMSKHPHRVGQKAYFPKGNLSSGGKHRQRGHS